MLSINFIVLSPSWEETKNEGVKELLDTESSVMKCFSISWLKERNLESVGVGLIEG
jgi:hypothetical protein